MTYVAVPAKLEKLTGTTLNSSTDYADYGLAREVLNTGPISVGDHWRIHLHPHSNGYSVGRCVNVYDETQTGTITKVGKLSDFKLYDNCFNIVNKPASLTNFTDTVSLLTGSSISGAAGRKWSNIKARIDSGALATTLLAVTDGKLVVLDLEGDDDAYIAGNNAWACKSVGSNPTDTTLLNDYILHWIELVRYAKQVYADNGRTNKVGVYGCHQGDYFPPADHVANPNNAADATDYYDWLINIRAVKSIFAEVDFISPSIYPEYLPDVEITSDAKYLKFKYFVQETVIKKGEIWGRSKPFYAYCSFQHQSETGDPICSQWFTTEMLKITSNLAVAGYLDGVIWFANSGVGDWNSTTGIQRWYDTTLEYLF